MNADCQNRLKDVLMHLDAVTEVVFREEYIEIYLQSDLNDELLKAVVESCGEYGVQKID